MNIRWLLQAARWVRNPPPMKTVIAVLGVVAICLFIVFLEYLGLLPDWMTVDRAAQNPPRF